MGHLGESTSGLPEHEKLYAETRSSERIARFTIGVVGFFSAMPFYSFVIYRSMCIARGIVPASPLTITLMDFLFQQGMQGLHYKLVGYLGTSNRTVRILASMNQVLCLGGLCLSVFTVDPVTVLVGTSSLGISGTDVMARVCCTTPFSVDRSRRSAIFTTSGYLGPAWIVILSSVFSSGLPDWAILGGMSTLFMGCWCAWICFPEAALYDAERCAVVLAASLSAESTSSPEEGGIQRESVASTGSGQVPTTEKKENTQSRSEKSTSSGQLPAIEDKENTRWTFEKSAGSGQAPKTKERESTRKGSVKSTRSGRSIRSSRITAVGVGDRHTFMRGGTRLSSASETVLPSHVDHAFQSGRWGSFHSVAFCASDEVLSACDPENAGPPAEGILDLLRSRQTRLALIFTWLGYWNMTYWPYTAFPVMLLQKGWSSNVVASVLLGESFTVAFLNKVLTFDNLAYEITIFGMVWWLVCPPLLVLTFCRLGHGGIVVSILICDLTQALWFKAMPAILSSAVPIRKMPKLMQVGGLFGISIGIMANTQFSLYEFLGDWVSAALISQALGLGFLVGCLWTDRVELCFWWREGRKRYLEELGLLRQGGDSEAVSAPDLIAEGTVEEGPTPEVLGASSLLGNHEPQ
mmetsp:Transcript_67908/g.189642  ORF Transcript_67908/g.189642 Transcript_67908/m.189642 type:complete len:635 (-) Transcript_67908:194-2098(-)